uniref:MIF4G_like_2 domain-containing protein n=1 Tax=Rodentolepis nana TaxID=102285 RepID=A0A0R3TIT4_RODNA
LIEASSRNRMCQLILRHVHKRTLKCVNDILNTNPIIRGLVQGLKYEHFQGTLLKYEQKAILDIVTWEVFWCDFICGLLEDFDPNIKETIKCFVSGMSYEAYCIELSRFVAEIEARTNADFVRDLKDIAIMSFDTVGK